MFSYVYKFAYKLKRYNLDTIFTESKTFNVIKIIFNSIIHDILIFIITKIDDIDTTNDIVLKFLKRLHNFSKLFLEDREKIQEFLDNIGLMDRKAFILFKLKEIKTHLMTTPEKKMKYWKYDFESMWAHFLKKYIYTINHKRIALNYMYFTIFSGLSGAMLASFIRLELAYPGSHFFKGDSIRYIQVISSHGLVMIFYVVVPLVFGLFANYFIPYHILAKDVSFPRLNSIGFWLLPAGYLLMAKPAFTRRQVYKFWDPYDAYRSVTESILKNFVEIMASEDYGVAIVKHKIKYSHLNEIFARAKESSLDITKKEFMNNLVHYAAWEKKNDALFKELLINNSQKLEYFNFCKSLGSDISGTPLEHLYNYVELQSLINSYNESEGIFTEDMLEFNKSNMSRINRMDALDFFYATLRNFDKAVDVTPKNLTMAAAIKGRISEENDDWMSVIQNWTDFLMLWEINHQWYENPWQTLRHALRNKTIVMKNEKCSSPTSVMAGWTFITPFSSQTRFTGLGAQDAAIISVLFAGVSTTISFTNLLITRRVLAAPGFRNRKNAMPFITISLFLVMRMLALITPVLGAAMAMLLMDRHWSTSFFDYAYGGDSILFHHLFWFFGHPEVYVIIIPAFGIVNSFLPHYNNRRIASKNHLVWATYVMAYMGFLVWGHHMYLVGLDHRSRSLYSTITVMISLPAVVKIVNWTLTLLNGVLVVDISLYFIIAFLTFFLSGGLTGLWLSHVGLNIYVHDTFYVVAHFHFMFSCATFSAIFAGFYFYYKEFFGVEYSKPIAAAHCIYWTLGQWITFMPLYWVGYNGLPRRYHDYPVMYMGWQGMATSGHLLTMIGIFIFFFGIVESKLRKQGIILSSLGIPRTFKRSQYYVLKNSKNQLIDHEKGRHSMDNLLHDPFL